ncbi:MAG: HAMP domain-containing sensor histidine kinase [Planctomycetota bacterium]
MRSSVVFGVVLSLSMLLLAWWVTFQVRESNELERAGTALIAEDIDGAARAFGADDRHGLAALARSRRRMFFSEAAVFAGVLFATGLLFVASKRVERRVLQSHARFLAGATHELKTPLATIRLGLESIADPRVAAAARERYLRAMIGETDRLERGLSNLLETAALRAEGAMVHPRPGDLADDLRSAVEELQARADAAGVKLLGEIDGSVTLARDPKAVRLVLHNLLDNAVKFSPRDATVRVALRPGSERVEVVVADSGAGIPPADLRRVFEPFWRGEGSAGGAGLGLHLARELARAHGGDVEAHSAGTGQGATFVFWLPRREIAS